MGLKLTESVPASIGRQKQQKQQRADKVRVQGCRAGTFERRSNALIGLISLEASKRLTKTSQLDDFTTDGRKFNDDPWDLFRNFLKCYQALLTAIKCD